MPFFEWQGYVGGSGGSERPTTYMGPFIVIGAYIGLLEQHKVARTTKRLVCIFSFLGWVSASLVTIMYARFNNGYVDYFFQPVELHIITMALGYITLFYYIPDRLLTCNENAIKKAAELSLGVYILHPLIGSIFRRTALYSEMMKSSVNVLLLNLINWVLICMVCIIVSYIVKTFLPKGINKYLM